VPYHLTQVGQKVLTHHQEERTNEKNKIINKPSHIISNFWLNSHFLVAGKETIIALPPPAHPYLTKGAQQQLYNKQHNIFGEKEIEANL
jgi:hypothetical protein